MAKELRVFLCRKAEEPGAGPVSPWFEIREALHDADGNVSSWDDGPVMLEGRDLAALLEAAVKALEGSVWDAENGRELGSYPEVCRGLAAGHSPHSQ